MHDSAGSTQATPGSRLEPLTAARDAAVSCDLTPLAVLSISGPDSVPFLQGQLSADVGVLAANACSHATFNSPKGRMLANFVLWRGTEDGHYGALVPGDIAAGVLKRLSMYVLRSKVSLRDASGDLVRLGVGGPDGGEAMNAAFGQVPGPYETGRVGDTMLLGLPGPRFIVLSAPDAASALRRALAEHTHEAAYDVWEWLTIRAGVPVVTAPTQDLFVAQTANLDLLRGIDFKKGCYTGQEIIARTQYLGRLKERAFLFHADDGAVSAGARLYSEVFGDQPCGTVVNAALAPGGGCDLLAVVQVAAAERDDLRLGSTDGLRLVRLPLPYAIPPAAAPRGRTG